MPDRGESSKSYHAYLLDAQGKILKPLIIEASNDSEAIKQAKQYVDGHAVELWERSRKVALLPTDE